MPRKSLNHRKGQQTPRTKAAKVKGFAAINRVRKGESKSLSAAARAEGTTVRTIRRLLPAALTQGRRGERIRVKAGDPYSWPVAILTDSGPIVVNARGSRQRDLAGQHRAVYRKVLGNKLPASALQPFRGKKIGGQELVSDYAQLSRLQQAGVIDKLATLYSSPETNR